MTVRTYTQKDGTVWEWEETKELADYIKGLHIPNGNTQGGAQSPKTKG